MVYLILPHLEDDRGKPQVLTKGKRLRNGNYQWFASGVKFSGPMADKQNLSEEDLKEVPVIYKNLCRVAPVALMRRHEW